VGAQGRRDDPRQDDQTFGDLLYAVVTGQRNNEDSARKSNATRAGLKRRAERGQPVGALPIGYVAAATVIDGVPLTRRVIDVDTAPLVERILDLAGAGHTPGDISRTLNAEGAVTRRGKSWTTRAVRTVIQNRDYLGDNGYPALIDQAVWNRAQSPKQSRPSSSPRTPADDFVLGGMAVCFHCGATMRARRAINGKRTYRCSNAMEGRNLCTVSRPVPADDAERDLIAHVVGYMPDLDDWLREQAQGTPARTGQRGAGAAGCEDRPRGHGTAAGTLLDDYERLPPDEARLVLRRATSVQAERDTAEQRIRDLEAVVAEHDTDPDVDAARDLYARLLAFAQGRLDQASSPAEVRAALRSVIAVVELGHDGDDLAVAAGLRLVEPEPFTFVSAHTQATATTPRARKARPRAGPARARRHAPGSRCRLRPATS
jgi:hypothetical protein